MQRVMDLILSGIALVVLFPLLCPIFVLLRLTGEGEVFYMQERIGRSGKPFRLFKFATMLKDSPYIGTGTITLKNDPRVLPVGKLLRKSKLNELPQLLNVLRGDMSLVGPRPQTARCFAAFPQELQAAIKQVRPGLSGLGSILFRGEEDLLSGRVDSVAFYDGVIAPYKGQVEAWYVDHRSIKLYILVLFLTLWVVVFPASDLVWKVFRQLPPPPGALQGPLRYRKV